VYWHHAVRSATAMYKRLVADALARGELALDELGHLTDEGLLHSLEQSRAAAPLLRALRERRLYKRLLEISAADLEEPSAEWISSDLALVTRVEDAIAGELGLEPGEVLLDYPEKPQMLGLDIPVRQRDGRVRHLTPLGWPGAINLPALSDELYRSARRLRVFTARPLTLSADRLLATLVRPPAEIVQALDGDERLVA